MAQFVWIDHVTPNGSAPPTFTAWGGYVIPLAGPGPGVPPQPPKVTCELLDLNLPAPTAANPNSQRVQLIDPCPTHCGSTQWRATFGGGGNPIPPGNNYRLKAVLYVNGAQRDADTVDPFTVAENVLAINPACPVVLPGDIIRIEVPPPISLPIPGPPPEVLGAAVGGLVGVGPRPEVDVDIEIGGVRRSGLLTTAGRSFPIAFDFPWDPRITGCIGLVYGRGTTTLVSVTSGSLTIGRCGVAVPIPTDRTTRYTAKVLLIDDGGQVLLQSPDIGMPR